MSQLKDKVCIVTGSSSGLGRAIALAYAREGARAVVCADLKPTARADVPAELEVTTDEYIRKEYGDDRALFVQTDVSKSKDMEDLVAATVEAYGRLDVLVNNAGISLEANRSPLSLHETPDDWWDTTMAINSRSVFLGCKYALRQMEEQTPNDAGDRGWIINISSVFGLVGGRNNVCYAASKGAVTNLTRSVAVEYGPSGIHCNAICPGFTRTAIFKNTTENLAPEAALNAAHPLHGVGDPEDIAGTAVFLASPQARWVTGVNLPVDGGYTAR